MLFTDDVFFYYPLVETQPFVDKLFEAINNKSYLPQPEQPSSLVKVEKDEQKKDEVMSALLLCQHFLGLLLQACQTLE